MVVERSPRPSKARLDGKLVKLLFHTRHDRGMTLIEHASRCVRQGELHEVVSTDQLDAQAGSRIDRVGFIGFVEIQQAGVIERGDLLWSGDACLGWVLGFDECHFPNHYNILIATHRLMTADTLNDAGIGSVLHFEEQR
ncbi:DUF6917 domain-containing protein [Pseudomonas sp. S1(2024)]|uniref:DUF6917 domain-containing protein n=1 Tax=Pseudomonas sp. S1(2024) TaxID=3390191 RepID=UPI00397C9FDC